jgi:hypothetical protein
MFAAQGRAMGEPAPAGGDKGQAGNDAKSLDAKISDLRAKRIAGSITERQYFEELEPLAQRRAAAS